ncbi:OsmC family protein [Streptomonospora nanhaiensis]|uniref:Organic hydroperoxide reductase OsmC/OhrA n=1 Tax=Streptomonospora nanhaiensis TaxID=1323731 RepID=A0A853BRC7_9ACTN|nr:OsmC family protein [Streptomonospora nanhaiensis]MBV2362703.1 OsmC family protein [Streptomonospora nanhaiensis]MBX9389161.1 OsmC family protein [Streptomonospora nanhaiensis]NYI97948.1 organic hydroperoxide reductase OsmC/OhrA [Streptomonospora nanhaiensis]
MADKSHHYEVAVRWTGNTGSGTAGYRAYERSHDITAEGRPTLPGSADAAFRGDPARWNPEDLLVAALSECHMLSYLALSVAAGVNVVAYTDTATGTMVTHRDSSGEFTEVTLHPVVTVAEAGMVGAAAELHERAHRACFIARSVNFPVRHEPEIRVAGAA